MNKKVLLYSVTALVSVILFIIAMTVLGETKFIAPILIVFSIYLFCGIIIKLCKLSDKLKKSAIAAVDLLFWLP